MAWPTRRFFPSEAFRELVLPETRIEGYGSVLTATDHVGVAGATGCTEGLGGLSICFIVAPAVPDEMFDGEFGAMEGALSFDGRSGIVAATWLVEYSTDCFVCLLAMFSARLAVGFGGKGPFGS